MNLRIARKIDKQLRLQTEKAPEAWRVNRIPWRLIMRMERRLYPRLWAYVRSQDNCRGQR